MPRIKLTKSAVDAIPLRPSGQQIYFDTVMIGFGLVVGKTAKTYMAQRQIGPKTVRVTIGRHGVFTPDQARARAQQLLSAMAMGEDPNEQRRLRKAQAVTLEDAFGRYLQARPKLRPITVATYRRVIGRYLHDWRGLALEQISPDMVSLRHKKLAVDHGEPTANNAMRVLRAVYNLATVVYERPFPNPTRRLTLTRAWYREQRRHTVILPHQLPSWYRAVHLLDEDSRDYLLVLLFTGMRRSEALRLLWDDIDLNARTLMVRDTKNGEPLMLPLSDFLFRLFESRGATASPTSEFVFPGKGVTGHMVEPKKMLAQARSLSSVVFTLHDLRRTFITTAESLDVSVYALKRLLNHRDRHDVTAGYIVLSVERLRRPMQMITDALLAQIAGPMKAGAKQSPLPELVNPSRVSADGSDRAVGIDRIVTSKAG